MRSGAFTDEKLGFALMKIAQTVHTVCRSRKVPRIGPRTHDTDAHVCLDEDQCSIPLKSVGVVYTVLEPF